MRQMGTVLLYNLGSDKGRKIRMLCLKMGIKIRNVDSSQYGEMIGALAGIPGLALTGEAWEGETFDDEMLVMKGFTGSMLDAFLNGFRVQKIPRVDLKAVITETNATWNSYELHEEIRKEHEAMHQQNP